MDENLKLLTVAGALLKIGRDDVALEPARMRELMTAAHEVILQAIRHRMGLKPARYGFATAGLVAGIEAHHAIQYAAR